MRKTESYIIEAAIGIAFCYFVLGGSRWSPALWAVFALFAIWIVIMNIRRNAGIESVQAYERWHSRVGFLILIALLVASIWPGSWMLFAFTAVFGAIRLSDLRAYRRVCKRSLEKLGD